LGGDVKVREKGITITFTFTSKNGDAALIITIFALVFALAACVCWTFSRVLAKAKHHEPARQPSSSNHKQWGLNYLRG
jgi:flagellar basal body-associated protein FliL